MFKFTYIEDYIEFIGGWRSRDGKLASLFDNVDSPLSLARYDEKIVASLAEQTAINNKGYTDKQGELAKKLVEKYRRQLSKLSDPIIVPEVVDQFRTPLRQVDRSKTVHIEDGLFVVKFPYDVKLIDSVKLQMKTGYGRAEFDHDKKLWYMAQTESNLNWIMTMKDIHGIQVSEEIESLYAQMLEVEAADNRIYLYKDQTEYKIHNASESLLNYISETIGTMTDDNLLRLVDSADTLGFEVDDSIRQQVCDLLGNNQALCNIVNKRRSLIKQDELNLDSIIEYARLTNRLPVHVYSTGLPKEDTNEIKYLNRGKAFNVFPKLLVSYTSTMIGSKKESWQINAEKIIFLE